MIPKLDCRKCTGAVGSAFSCLTPAQRSRLAQIAIPHAYLRGQALVYEETPPLAVFCIQSGVIKIFHWHNDSEQVVVAVQTPGNLLGYRDVLAELPYGFSAEVIEPAVVCTIPREDFLALIGENSELALHLMKKLATEFHHSEYELVERNGNRVATRTARLLTRLAEQADPAAATKTRVPITMRRDDMAQLIGTSPETLSRTLHDFADRGVLEVNRRDLGVRDLAALRTLAR